jgi:isopentenyl-diphosphate delta-isomerase
MSEQQVILVDEKDQPVGIAGKMETHRNGWLHRAFSIFVFNAKGEMLLQQRALKKYHSGGLWSNACCGHPRPGEDTLKAAQNRLKEETGLETPISKLFDFIYRSDFGNGLTEHEFDHVYIGETSGEMKLNKDEAMELCFKTIPEIRQSLETHPSKYTSWFHLAFPVVEKWWKDKYGNVA